MMSTLLRGRFSVIRRSLSYGCIRLATPYSDVVTFENVVFPPDGQYLLPALPLEPTYDEKIGEKEFKGSKRIIESRGVELVHTNLIHKQFGLAAKTGGQLVPEDFTTIMTDINGSLQEKQFAIWRVDAPWLPRWAKPQGKKKGGGKGPIYRYVTPVKAERIIVELGGYITELEARAYVTHLCTAFKTLPMEFVSQQLLDERRQLEPVLEQSNLNRFNWDIVTKYNMQNVYAWMPTYDLLWKGKYK